MAAELFFEYHMFVGFNQIGLWRAQETLWSGDVHIAGLGGDALVVPILIPTVSAWKNAMAAMHRCVEAIDGAHGKADHHNFERNPFREMLIHHGES